MGNAIQKKDSTAYAGQMLDKLRELDQLVHGAYYDMGRILSSIAHGKLYDALGYDSMGHLIDEELSFSRSQAQKYLHTYRNFRRLGYTKTEALDLINDFSFSHMARALREMSEKLGKRAIKNLIDKQLAEARQINFTVNAEEHEILIAALKSFGADDTSGRLMYSSDALIAMARYSVGE